MKKYCLWKTKGKRCNMVFHSLEEFNKHLMTQHVQIIKKEQSNEHQKQKARGIEVERLRGKKIRCGWCGKSLTRQTIVRHVENTHSGCVRFNCSFCNYQTNYRYNFSRHLCRCSKFAHCKTCDVLEFHRQICCPICDLFVCELNYESHMLMMHNDMLLFWGDNFLYHTK